MFEEDGVNRKVVSVPFPILELPRRKAVKA
jgi:hypothetical protein